MLSKPAGYESICNREKCFPPCPVIKIDPLLNVKLFDFLQFNIIFSSPYLNNNLISSLSPSGACSPSDLPQTALYI